MEEVAEIFDGPNALSGVNAMKELGLDVNADKALALGHDSGDSTEKTGMTHVERAV